MKKHSTLEHDNIPFNPVTTPLSLGEGQGGEAFSSFLGEGFGGEALTSLHTDPFFCRADYARNRKYGAG